MASSARHVKKKHPIEDSFITVKQQHQTGDSFITLKQPHHTGDSIITVKHEHQTGDSIITVKHENQTGYPFITVKTMEMGGRVRDFRVKRDEPLQQLKMRWRVESRVEDYETFRFIFNGRMIPDDDETTANDIGLEDGCCIHAMPVLIGD